MCLQAVRMTNTPLRGYHTHKTRPPTLSYTQRLEQRIQELESEVRRLQTTGDSEADPGPSRTIRSASGEAEGSTTDSLENNIAGRFGGLKLDDKGIVTYHGSTSFFQDSTDQFIQEFYPLNRTPNSESLAEGSEVRDRLVSNAWEQRALETLSGIPVCRCSLGPFSPCDVDT